MKKNRDKPNISITAPSSQTDTPSDLQESQEQSDYEYVNLGLGMESCSSYKGTESVVFRKEEWKLGNNST